MARSVSIVADSEGRPDDAHAPEEEATNNAGVDGEEGEIEEEEEEYEIEEVLKHNKGQFPEGRLGYFVKWKNYGSEHNSWVDEQDAGNFSIAYWAKKNAAKAARTSRGRKSNVPASPEPSRKRRKSVKNDEEEEEQETPEAVPKEEEEGGEDELMSADKFIQQNKHRNAWDDLISRIDTVEKPSGSAKADDLVVYFRL
ncbi:hypothetical protein BT96DRAFT_994153 [Gymnopus androsaceus JB14]|uniref:Chromo domain-containing protein n=1 Tax=Gymnopus androsaceus JB14 TaxID=1447944 RepID=A0A6A4HME4_9AGAR|nr:hypothetical protein BT96DRAFT_994153 [Gymnopus androsaceus JB14]